ncbi:hypothetical protein LWI29_034412 [Acer saccharum]|uniref:Uncharacterized protein n=1 Tax=Acer saccharum TaxID=4024 RepID=A0AA39T874_ACESA|nr:hypothetical protein LWI29_034412 [Acer saccharum]
MLLTMQDMFLHSMRLGIFLLATCLVFFQKAYKAPSIEALRQGKFAAARVEFMGFEFLKEVAIPRMLKKDTGQLDDRILNNFSCVILGGLVAEHKISTRIRLIDPKVRCKKKAMVLFVKMIISCALQHEADHFLVGYSIGVLPKGYMVPSIEALRQRKFTAARVEFMVSSSLKKSPFQEC